MSHHGRDTVVVSPPSFERTDFARVDTALSAPHGPHDRGWLMARFAEGLQIRLLKPPHQGLILFQPGKLAWRPVDGAGRALVVHDLRVAPGPIAREGAARLWSAAEDFARYYGFVAVLALIGRGAGLISRDHAPGRGWLTLDEGPAETRLVGRILQGPLELPRLPRDWDRRASALGPGLVVQTTGEYETLEARAAAIVAAASARGIAARRDRLTDPEMVHARAVRPGAVCTVVADGVLLGGPELSVDTILALSGGPPAGQRPS
ncbi:hypothetical protein [Roseicyclus mahoneyensis]|uniref:Uncharacterized protein n=1 Tax=Roseicyclus mahoneyensis TaxID=164332 RepID=A0A316G385_9RHOB|nr:hypothetical protein [Roseicyclus mahoneyensis]PWK55319.1 hypothetical protein C7455_11810 [Roseicyclus mahoneyensis]